MRNPIKPLLAAALFLALGACFPASAATITFLSLDRGPGDMGRWSTSGLGWIGVTNPGDAANNPFLNNLSTGSIDIPGGTYYLFFGFEDYWTTFYPAPGTSTTATLTVGYSDGSTRSATFAQESSATASWWSVTSGDPGLLLGGTGITGIDRMGNTSFGADGSNDIILEFSDSVPEPGPAVLLLIGAGAILAARKRRA